MTPKQRHAEKDPEQAKFEIGDTVEILSYPGQGDLGVVIGYEVWRNHKDYVVWDGTGEYPEWDDTAPDFLTGGSGRLLVQWIAPGGDSNVLPYKENWRTLCQDPEIPFPFCAPRDLRVVDQPLLRQQGDVWMATHKRTGATALATSPEEARVALVDQIRSHRNYGAEV